MTALLHFNQEFHNPAARWDESNLFQLLCVPCNCLLPYQILSLSWVEVLPPNPATICFPTACRPITCSGVSTCKRSFHSSPFTSTFSTVCASSKISSIYCALPLQGLGLVMLCQIPLLLRRCQEAFPPKLLGCSNLSAFRLSSSFCVNKAPILPTKVRFLRSSILAYIAPLTADHLKPLPLRPVALVFLTTHINV